MPNGDHREGERHRIADRGAGRRRVARVKEVPEGPVSSDVVHLTVGWLWLAFPPPFAWSAVNSVWLMTLSKSEALNAVGTR